MRYCRRYTGSFTYLSGILSFFLGKGSVNHDFRHIYYRLYFRWRDRRRPSIALLRRRFRARVSISAHPITRTSPFPTFHVWFPLWKLLKFATSAGFLRLDRVLNQDGTSDGRKALFPATAARYGDFCAAADGGSAVLFAGPEAVMCHDQRVSALPFPYPQRKKPIQTHQIPSKPHQNPSKPIETPSKPHQNPWNPIETHRNPSKPIETHQNNITHRKNILLNFQLWKVINLDWWNDDEWTILSSHINDNEN